MKQYNEEEDEEAKGELEKEIYNRLLMESDQQYAIEFQVKRFSVGSLPFWVFKLRDVKAIRPGHTTLHEVDEIAEPSGAAR